MACTVGVSLALGDAKPLAQPAIGIVWMVAGVPVYLFPWKKLSISSVVREYGSQKSIL